MLQRVIHSTFLHQTQSWSFCCNWVCSCHRGWDRERRQDHQRQERCLFFRLVWGQWSVNRCSTFGPKGADMWKDASKFRSGHAPSRSIMAWSLCQAKALPRKRPPPAANAEEFEQFFSEQNEVSSKVTKGTVFKTIKWIKCRKIRKVTEYLKTRLDLVHSQLLTLPLTYPHFVSSATSLFESARSFWVLRALLFKIFYCQYLAWYGHTRSALEFNSFLVQSLLICLPSHSWLCCWWVLGDAWFYSLGLYGRAPGLVFDSSWALGLARRSWTLTRRSDLDKSQEGHLCRISENLSV